MQSLTSEHGVFFLFTLAQALKKRIYFAVQAIRKYTRICGSSCEVDNETWHSSAGS